MKNNKIDLNKLKIIDFEKLREIIDIKKLKNFDLNKLHEIVDKDKLNELINIEKKIEEYNIFYKKTEKNRIILIGSFYVVGMILLLIYGKYMDWTVLDVLKKVLLIIIVLLPAMIANSIPVIVKRLPILNFPIYSPRFGKNKTFRGFIFAVISGTIVFYLLNNYFDFVIIIISSNFNFSILPEYLKSYGIIILGFLMSFGAIFGDLVESFIKRRLKIPSGAPYTPRDQIDYIIGMIVFTYIFYQRNIIEIVIFCMYGGLTSFLAHNISYHLKLINTKR